MNVLYHDSHGLIQDPTRLRRGTTPLDSQKPDYNHPSVEGKQYAKDGMNSDVTHVRLLQRMLATSEH